MASVDTRVVSMEFDNAKFEKNATTTQKTLSKLKEMLNFKDAGKGFDNIDKAASKVNFSAIEKALQTVSNRFSTFGIIGMTVLQNLTNRAVDAGIKIGHALTSAITQGGKTRALNLEAARFQLEGLKADVDAVMEDVNYAVKGTAYGLDAAAKVASQLVASQIKSGDQMKTALRSISGVAAMTNSTYEDIGNIYTTVAGNGRLMSEQLLQFSSRGLNAAATLGEYLHKSEAEVREMVSKGKIDFNTFAEAMDSAFGEHAKDANKTFTGALSNMKAALSRLGAAFYTPGLEYARNVINALTPVIDDAKAALEPLINLVVKGMEVISKFAVNALNNLNLDKSLGLPIKNLDTMIRLRVVPGLVNIKDTIAGVFNSLRLGFREVFPETMSINQVIIKLSSAFFKLTEKIKPSKETLDDLVNIFQGVFAAANLVIKVIMAAATVFGKLLTALAPIGRFFMDVALAIAYYISCLDVATDKSDVFGEVTKTIGDAIDSFGNKLKSAYAKIKESLPGFFNSILSTLSTIGEKIKAAFSKIVEAAKNFSSGFTNSFDFSNVATVISAGLFGGVLYKITKFLKLLENAFESNKSDGLIAKVKNVIDQLGNTLGEFQQSIKANIILKIAIALGILAGACSVLAQIDPGRLASSLTAITVMFGELFGFMAGFGKVLDARSFINIDLVSGAMMKLAAAVLILAFAVEKLAKLSWKELVKGLGSVSVLCFVLGKTIQKARFDSLRPSTFIGLVGLAVSIRILASAVAKLGSLDLKSLIKGLGAMVVVLGSLVGFLFAVSKIKIDKNFATVGLGLVLLASSMIIFAAAVDKLGSLSVNQLIKGLGSLVVVLGALTAAMRFFPKSAVVLASATAMIEIALAISMLGFAISKLGRMSLKELAKGLGAMGVTLGMLTGVLAILSKVAGKTMGVELIAVAGAIGILAISINILVPALMALGSMSLESIIKSLGMLTGVFLILGSAAAILAPLVPAILGLSGAVALLGIGIGALGAGVLALSVGLAGLSGSAFVIAESFAAIIMTLVKLLPEIAMSLAEAFVQFQATILKKAPEIIDGIVALVQSILDSLGELIPQVIDLVVNTLSQLMEALIELMPQFAELVTTTIQNLIQVITTLIPDLVQLGMNLIIGLLEGIRDNIYQVVTIAGEIIVNFLNGLSAQLPAIIQAGFDLMISFLNGLADSIRTNMGLVLDAVWNVITAIIESVLSTLVGAIGSMLSAGKEFIQGAIDGIGKGIEGAKNAVKDVVKGAIDKVKNFVGDMLNAGKDLIQGLIDGIKEMAGNVINAVGDMASGAIDTVKSWFGIASPSKVFKQIGVYTMEGLAIGIRQTASKVDQAIGATGSSAINTMKETLANIGNDLTDRLSSDITITPVLDLSEVNKGVDSIYSSFNKTAAISLEATNNRAVSALRMNNASTVGAKTSQTQVINNYDLTQNNYSPKALSRIDIYRDTKNQFSRLKGIGAA